MQAGCVPTHLLTSTQRVGRPPSTTGVALVVHPIDLDIARVVLWSITYSSVSSVGRALV